MTASAPAHAALLETYRPALAGHCYRMLGSVFDAGDGVQETMLRAWKGIGRFENRSALETWLYKIATNVCLDAISHRGPRLRPTALDGPQTIDGDLTTRPMHEWVEPVLDEQAIPSDADPAERAVMRESIRLAFVAALQYLPARQRAALLLTQVLNWSAAEVAESLDMTVPAVNSALQRARETLAKRAHTMPPPAPTEAQAALAAKYFEAFERYDVAALATLLREDATFCMPPYEMWLQGHESIAAWMLGPGAGCRGSKLVSLDVCGSPAFAQYRSMGAVPWALIVLDVDGASGQVAGVTSFLDVATLFPRFGLPPTLES